MVRAVFIALVGTLLMASAAAASPAVTKGQAVPVRLSAELECAPGGANVTFTVRNVGQRTLTIGDDFHLFLDKVGPGGREPVAAVFVFPAPEFRVIAPGTQKTFLVPIGIAEAGEPGIDLSARRLLLEAEVFFEGRERSARRHFSFPGCNP